MISTKPRESRPGRRIDWQIILFFILAYTIAWGAFGILVHERSRYFE